MTSNNSAKRTVFLVSDSTGITVEGMARALLSQFPVPTRQVVMRYVDTIDKCQQVVAQINAEVDNGQGPVIVFSTLINTNLRQCLETARVRVIDFMAPFIKPLETEFGLPAEPATGYTHSLQYELNYGHRIEAVHFAMEHDDGHGLRHYSNADIILIGLSRCGKTPTCMYLAMHYGLLAANYPLVDEDLQREDLPEALQPFREKLFALRISPERLYQIRQQRMPGSRYASRQQCEQEIRQAEALYQHLGIPSLDVTKRSVEEIATAVLGYLQG